MYYKAIYNEVKTQSQEMTWGFFFDIENKFGMLIQNINVMTNKFAND